MKNDELRDRFNIFVGIYMQFYIIPTIIEGIMCIYTRTAIGDETLGLNLQFNRLQIFLLLLVRIAILLLAKPIFQLSQSVKLQIDKSHKFKSEFSHNIHIFIFALFLVQLFATVLFGNGKVSVDGGSTTQHNFITTILSLLKIQCIFPLYYIFARDEKNKIYWINILMYILIRLTQGWSSVILQVVMFELFYFIMRTKNTKIIRALKYFPTLFISGLLFAGAFLYKFIWPLKHMIRYGYSVGTISFFESLEKLVSRLTDFPLSLVAYQNNSKIAALYKSQGIWNAEFLSFFRSLLPRNIMPVKEFRKFGNLVKQSIWLGIGTDTSSGYDPVARIINFISSNIVGLILVLLLFILLFWITKTLLASFDNYLGGQLLLFMFIFDVVNGLDIETLFAYGYIGGIYILIILYILKIYRVRLLDTDS